jgi:hypothetical protein
MGLALKLDKIPKVRAEDAAPKAAAAPSGGAVGSAQVFEVSEFVTCSLIITLGTCKESRR